MSGASANDYHPGLEGVIASETAIANIEGKDGAGGLEYRGYRIEDLAGHVSYEETAFLLLHGDLPNREQLREFDARLRRSRAIPEPLVDPAPADPRAHPSRWTRSAPRSASCRTSTPTSTPPRPTTPPTSARPSA